jgi:hypothetical protein
VGLHQSFRFERKSQDDVRAFLQGLSHAAALNGGPEFYVFSQLPGAEAFTFDCELTETGLVSERAGKYFEFLGIFVEALTGTFGAVEVQDV